MQAFLRKEFESAAGFGPKTDTVDYDKIYAITPKESVQFMSVKQIYTVDRKHYEIVQVDYLKEIEKDDSVSDINISNENNASFSNSNVLQSRSISCNLEQQIDIFSQFLGGCKSEKENILQSNMNMSANKSPPRKRVKLNNNISINNIENDEIKLDSQMSNSDNTNNNNSTDYNSDNINDSEINNEDSATYELCRRVFVIGLEQHKVTDNVPGYESDIGCLWEAGNLNMCINYQIKQNGKSTGHMVLVDLIENGQSKIYDCTIPIVQHLKHKPSDAMSIISKVIAVNIGGHAQLNTDYCDLMKIYYKEYICKQINQAQRKLFTVGGPGGYYIITEDGRELRVIVLGNKDLVMNYTDRKMDHPWKCNVYLNFDEDSRFPRFVPGQIDECLEEDVINDFSEMYNTKERMQFCKGIGLNKIGLIYPQLFRDNGGINPGLHLHSPPDKGKSTFLGYLMAALGCPLLGQFACKDPKIILGNYTEAAIQKQADDMPGFIIILEDADRETGNKKYVPIGKLIWILAEVNSNNTITHGDRAGATGAYITTGNVDLTFIKEEGSRTRIHIETFDPPIISQNAFKIQEMIAKAPRIHDQLAMRVQRVLMSGLASDKTVKSSTKIINQLQMIVQNQNQHLQKYCHNRARLVDCHVLAETIKVNKLLFGGLDEQGIIKEYVSSIYNHLQICYNVNENPMEHGMGFKYEVYLRYFIFCVQCFNIDVKCITKLIDSVPDVEEINLLTKIRELVIMNKKQLSCVVKDEYIGVKQDVLQKNKVLGLEHIADLCKNVIIYHKKYIKSKQQNENKQENDIGVEEKECDTKVNMLKTLSSCWTDDLLMIDCIEKNKMMKECDFRVFFRICDENGKCISEPQYNTVRANRNRYFAFIIPQSLRQYIPLLKLKRKKGNVKSNNKSKPKNNNNINIEMSNDLKISKILNKIFQNDASSSFKQAVNTEQYPQYTEMVTNPIDLQIISNKTYKGNLNAFCKDIRLMCHNAMLFNEPKSSAYKHAKEILDLLFGALMNDNSADINANELKNSNNASISNEVPANINFNTNAF